MENNEIANCHATMEQPANCCVGGMCMPKEQCQGGMFLFGILVIAGLIAIIAMQGKILSELRKGNKKK